MRQILFLVVGFASCHVALPQLPAQPDSVADNRQKTLEEVVVTSRTAPYRLTKGGLQTKVSGSPLSDAGTAFDVLTQLPGVRTDEGTIEVIGKGTPLIYVNGRRMLDRSELGRMSSKEIQSVEVVSSPGAKYGADINAVILIKTIRRQGDGLSGSVQATGRQAHSFSQDDNVALNYRSGGVDVFGAFSLDYARRYQKQRNLTAIHSDKDSYYLSGDLLICPVTTTLTGSGGINWMLNPNHSFGAKYDYTAYPHAKSLWYKNEIFTVNTTEAERIASRTRWDSRSMPTNSVNLYYLGKVSGWTVSLFNDYYYRRSNHDQSVREIGNAIGESTVMTHNSLRNKMWASKGIASYVFGKNELEFGYEFTSTARKDRFITLTEGLRDADDGISESTVAGFVSVNVPVKDVEFYGGLRYERTVSDYYMFSSFVAEQSRKYSRLYPDFDFSFPIKSANFTLSYSAKTRRPLYSQLSSGIQYDDRFTYSTGNPHLTSEMRHSLSLAGVWRWIFFSVGWEYDKGAIVSVIDPYEEGSPISLMSYDNFPHLIKYNIVFSLSPKFGRWSPRLRLNVLGQRFDIATPEGRRDMNTPLLFWNFYNTVNLGSGFNLNADLTGRTQGDMDVVTLRPSWQLNVGLTKNLKDWFFQLQATDLFRTARGSMITYGGQMILDKWNYSDTQSLRLMVRYSFNTTMSRYKGKSAGTTEKSRL